MPVYEPPAYIYGMKSPVADTETAIRWQLEPFHPVSVLGHGIIMKKDDLTENASEGTVHKQL